MVWLRDMSGRRIRLPLPADKGRSLIDSVIGQLSDGYWENSPRMESYWRFLGCVAEGGEVAIAVASDSAAPSPFGKWVWNKARRMSDSEILSKFAGWIQKLGKAEEEDWPESGFKLEKGNKEISAYLGRHGQELTGGEIWEMRKQLLAEARRIR